VSNRSRPRQSRAAGGYAVSRFQRELTTPSLEAKIGSQIQPDPTTGCWLWQGSFDASGYPFTQVGGKRMGVHRFTYATFTKTTIHALKGLHVHHICRVRHCVNPEHLEVVAPSTHSRLHRDPEFESAWSAL
jgi:hypothetical protein